MTKKIVGNISHFFNKIGVAVIKVEEPITKGDKLIFESGDGEKSFEQEATSMQIDRQEIEKAEKGQEIGMKTNEEVRPGWKVYVEE